MGCWRLRWGGVVNRRDHVIRFRMTACVVYDLRLHAGSQRTLAYALVFGPGSRFHGHGRVPNEWYTAYDVQRFDCWAWASVWVRGSTNIDVCKRPVVLFYLTTIIWPTMFHHLAMSDGLYPVNPPSSDNGRGGWHKQKPVPSFSFTIPSFILHLLVNYPPRQTSQIRSDGPRHHHHRGMIFDISIPVVL